jgi:hypothetical protein
MVSVYCLTAAQIARGCTAVILAHEGWGQRCTTCGEENTDAHDGHHRQFVPFDPVTVFLNAANDTDPVRGWPPRPDAVTLSVGRVNTLPFAQRDLRGPALLPASRPLSLLTATELLWEIRRLYHALNALPWTERPDGSRGGHRQASPAYLALESQIRALSDRYKCLERASLTVVQV